MLVERKQPALSPDEVDPRPDFLRGPLAFVLHYVKARWKEFLVLFSIALAAAASAVAVQYVMKLLVDAIGTGRTDAAAAAWQALTYFLLLIAVESVLWRATGWLACRTTVGVGVDMRLELFEYLNLQPMRYFSDNLAGSLGQRITSTAGNFGSLTNTALWRVLPPCVDFVGAMMLFALLDWPMTMTLAVLVVMITGSLIWFGERGRQVHAAYARTANIAAGSLIDVIANMWVVKAFSAAGHEHRRLGELFGREASAQRESWMYTERARIFHDVALCILAGLMLSWCIKLWGEGRITPGDVVLVSALTFRILHGSRDFALAFIEMGQQLGFIQETLNVIAQKPGIIDLPGALSPRRAEGSIEFNEVSFRYETGRDAVHELSLKVPAGEKLGVVGPSGAGKSTLLHLVQRLSDPQAGAVLVGGLPVHRVTQDSLRQLLAVVPQEITLFHRSVLENIRIARPAASDEEVQQAASAAQCDVFVRNLPSGYSTIVGERGMKLSGGQRQRVALARAFLKDAPIIILDEATSALDTESELKVHDALLRRFQDRTVLAVAHRLSTLIAFDRVVVMDAGRVVEEGKPVDLLGGGGMFEQMWQLQMNGFRTLKAAAGSQGRSCGSTPDANASMN